MNTAQQNYQALPRWAILGVTVLCLLPIILVQVGMDFGSTIHNFDLQVASTMSKGELVDAHFYRHRSAFSHTLLEWSAVSAVIFTVCLGFCHFMVTRNFAMLVITTALFLIGCVDAYHTLAAGHLIETVADNSNLIPLTWAISRTFNAFILFIAASFLLMKSQNSSDKKITKTDTKTLAIACAAFIFLAYSIIHYFSSSTQLPQTQFPNSLITRPYDTLSLLLFIFAGLFLLPKLHRHHPSVFTHALIISMVPQCMAQLHMALGSSILFDSHFNIAHFLKIIAYLVPFMGLLIDYVNTYQKESKEEPISIETEEQVTAILAALSDATIISDVNEKIIYCNHAAQSLTGYPEEELRTKAFNSLFVQPNHINLNFEISKNAKQDQDALKYDIHILGKDGNKTEVEASFNRIINRGEALILSSYVDISDRSQAQLELKQFADKLTTKNKELDDFAYIASHDLKAPLRAIDNLALWISEDLDDKELVNEHIQMMRLRINRMHHLLDDLLEYSRVGKINSQLKQVDLSIMATDLYVLSTPPSGFSLKIGKSLPVFETMSVPLEQILRNLISNAIKHHDKPTGEIQFEVEDVKDFYKITIGDDGPGIDKKNHDKVFGMFQTLNSRDETEGSGMGLAMVKKIIESFDGRLEMDSALGEGTRFHVHWPKQMRIYDKA